jgi:uroporphyrinogen decarboxylase
MTSEERVLAALAFQKPDRMPLFDSFWPEFVDAWRRDRGFAEDADIQAYYDLDVQIVIPDETPFPGRAAVIEANEGDEISRTGWGVVQRCKSGTKFYEELDVALSDKHLLDRLAFESPLLDRRYPSAEDVADLKRRYCVFVKTGGPYLRTSNLRGMTQWLIDLAEDEAFARELAMRVTRHITAVGLEAIRRYDLYHTGIWFYDDMAANVGPMFSPRTFERVFLPCYEWMCEQYRAAGVEHILLHCDGNIEAILDMLIDVGIQGVHPVEPKAGMDVVKLRKRYGNALALLGGLDNAHVLTTADWTDLEAHVLHVLEAGKDGGLVIGAHSIGPDVSIARYDYVHRLIREHKYRSSGQAGRVSLLGQA